MILAAPKLRFPEFKDPWKPGHAGDAFRNSRAKGAAGLPIYSVTMDRGLVRRDSMDRHMAADAADGHNLRAQRGDVVYNMMRMWQGAVGLAHEECMVSPAYVVLSPKKHTSSQFFDQWFKAKRMLYLLGAYSHGITSDRLRLYADDFARIPLNLPSLPEQQKIAEFLGAVDAKLAALAAQKVAMERFKAGLMQKLFSQQIRFVRDDGGAFPDWAEMRLGDVLVITMGQSPDSGAYNDEGRGLPLIQGNADISNRTSAPRRFTSEVTKVCEIGDILISVRAPIGEISLSSHRACLGRGVASLKARGGQSQRFWLQFLLYYEPKWQRVGQGSTFSAISGPDIRGIKVLAPHSDEQQKIADALSAMDAKIQAVSDKETKLQTFKKGLLQQMFV